MPRNVRNFWIDGGIDGRKSKISGGPKRKDGGLLLNVYIRDKGSVAKGIQVWGATDPATGNLSLRVYDGETDSIVYEKNTTR